MKYFILTVSLVVLLCQCGINAAEIIWEKSYENDSINALGAHAKIILYDNMIYIGYDGRNVKFKKNSCGIMQLTLEGQLLKRKEFLSSREEDFAGFRINNNEFQFCSIFNISLFEPSGPLFCRYLDNDFKIIRTTKETEHSLDSPPALQFYNDNIISTGKTGLEYPGMSIYDKDCNYLGGFYIDTSSIGFFGPQQLLSYECKLALDDNYFWILPIFNEKSSKYLLHSMVLVKTDKLGQRIWKSPYFIDTIKYNGTMLLEIHELKNGNINVFGEVRTYTKGISHFIFTQFDKNGDFIWDKYHGIDTTLSTNFAKYKQLSNGNIVIGATRSYSLNKKIFSMWIFDSFGNPLDSLNWGIDTLNSIRDIVEKDNGNILVFGNTRHPTSDTTFDEKLYLAEIGYKQSSISEKQAFNEIRLMPSPSRDNLIIKMHDLIPKSIRLINKQGIAQHEINSISSSQLTLDISAYPAGIYFAVFEYADGTRQVEKFIKLGE